MGWCYTFLYTVLVLLYPSPPSLHYPQVRYSGEDTSYLLGKKYVIVVDSTYTLLLAEASTGDPTAKSKPSNPAPFDSQLDRNKFTAEELHTEVMQVLRKQHYHYSTPDAPESTTSSNQRTTTGTSSSIITDEHPTDQLLWRLERAARLSPYNITYWNDLGVLHMHRLSYEKAIDCFQLGLVLGDNYDNNKETSLLSSQTSLLTKVRMNLQQIYTYHEKVGTDTVDTTMITSRSNKWYTTSLLGYNLYAQIVDKKQQPYSSSIFSDTNTTCTIPTVWDKLPISTFIWSIHRQRKPNTRITDISTVSSVQSFTRKEYKFHLDYVRILSQSGTYISSYPVPKPLLQMYPDFLNFPFVITNLNTTRSWKYGENHEKGYHWWRLWSLAYFMKHYKDLRMVWDKDQWFSNTDEEEYVVNDDDDNKDALFVESIGNQDSDSRTNSVEQYFTSTVALLREVSNKLQDFETNSQHSATFNHLPSSQPWSYQASYIRGHLSFKTWETLSSEIGKLPSLLGRDNDDLLLQYLFLAFVEIHGGGRLSFEMIQKVCNVLNNGSSSKENNGKGISQQTNAWVSPELSIIDTNTEKLLDYEFKFFLNDFFSWTGWRSLVIAHSTEGNRYHKYSQESSKYQPSVWRSMVLQNVPYGQWFVLVRGRNVEWTLCEKYTSPKVITPNPSSMDTKMDNSKSTEPHGWWSIDSSDDMYPTENMDSVNRTFVPPFNSTHGTVTSFLKHHNGIYASNYDNSKSSGESRECHTTKLYPGDIVYVPNNYEYSIQSTNPSIYLNGISTIQSSVIATENSKERFSLFLDTLILTCKQQLRDIPNLPYTETQQYVGNMYNSLSSNMAYAGRPNENICQILEKSKEIHMNIYEMIQN